MKKNPVYEKSVPEIGDIAQGNHIGFRTSTKYIYLACDKCGKKRWVQIGNVGKKDLCLCRKCAVKEYGYKRWSKGKRWKGGIHHTKQGYIKVRIYPNDFFYSMADGCGYVIQHRLVLAKHLGRCLHKWEIVHHRNHIKDDNSIENLQLVTDDRHRQITLLERRIDFLEKRVTILEAENLLLKNQVGVR